ncbi:MAG: hypothetical protein JXM70_13720 [Pirellulales bacterium]|nr:hypothetical protein [Pirellulales bacterium]
MTRIATLVVCLLAVASITSGDAGPSNIGWFGFRHSLSKAPRDYAYNYAFGGCDHTDEIEEAVNCYYLSGGFSEFPTNDQEGFEDYGIDPEYYFDVLAERYIDLQQRQLVVVVSYQGDYPATVTQEIIHERGFAVSNLILQLVALFSCPALRITGGRWSATELPVRVHGNVSHRFLSCSFAPFRFRGGAHAPLQDAGIF